MIGAEQEQADMIKALPGWIEQVQAEERSWGCPRTNSGEGPVGPSNFQADLIVGCKFCEFRAIHKLPHPALEQHSVVR